MNCISVFKLLLCYGSIFPIDIEARPYHWYHATRPAPPRPAPEKSVQLPYLGTEKYEKNLDLFLNKNSGMKGLSWGNPRSLDTALKCFDLESEASAIEKKQS